MLQLLRDVASTDSKGDKTSGKSIKYFAFTRPPCYSDYDPYV